MDPGLFFVRVVVGLSCLKRVRVQVVPCEKFVKVGTVAFRESCGLADVTQRNLEYLREVISGEFVSGVGE